MSCEPLTSVTTDIVAESEVLEDGGARVCAVFLFFFYQTEWLLIVDGRQRYVASCCHGLG